MLLKNKEVQQRFMEGGDGFVRWMELIAGLVVVWGKMPVEDGARSKKSKYK